MFKKAYLLFSSIAILSLVGASLIQAPSQKLEAAETSYTRSVTITGALLQRNAVHDPYSIVVGGLSISVGSSVYSDSLGRILIDGTYANGTAIIFPKVQSVSGPHGTGYVSVTWTRPSLSGNYCDDIGVRCYTTDDYYHDVLSTLSAASPVVTAIPNDHSSTIKLYSGHTDGYYTVLSQIVVTYNCSAS